MMQDCVNCYRVTVKNRRGKVVLTWKASLFTWVAVRSNGGRTVIEKRNLLGTRTYIPAITESVETTSWWVYLFG